MTFSIEHDDQKKIINQKRYSKSLFAETKLGNFWSYYHQPQLNSTYYKLKFKGSIIVFSADLNMAELFGKPEKNSKSIYKNGDIHCEFGYQCLNISLISRTEAKSQSLDNGFRR